MLVHRCGDRHDTVLPSPVLVLDEGIAPLVQHLCDALRKAGKLINSNRLRDSTDATTVRIVDGKAKVQDGPYADTKEQLGGYYLIEARDRDEAVGIAARVPPARVGTVEIRPVLEISGLPAGE